VQDLIPIRRSRRFWPVAGAIVILAGLTLWFAWPRADKTVVTAPRPAPKTAPPAAQQPVPAAPPGSPQQAPEAQPTQPAAIVAHPTPIAATARIEFTTNPSVDATVTWGRKKMGVIARRRPLVLTRPRDSGPLDVLVTAEGFLPVHTRAHTFGDSKVVVKLTAIDQQATLLGYRAPLDAGVPLLPDGGDQELPPALSPAPVPLPVPVPAPAPFP
jgi:hypothetical protein